MARREHRIARELYAKTAYIPIPDDQRVTRACYERMRRRLSGVQLSLLCHVPTTRLSTIENGNAAGAAAARRLAKAYGIDDYQTLNETIRIALVVVDERVSQ